MNKLITRLLVSILLSFLCLPTIVAQDCSAIEITGGQQKIEVKNLTAPIEILQVFDENYNLIFRCEGTDCGTEQTIADLTEGLYRANVQFYDANWQFICQTETQEVTVLSGNTGGGDDCDDLNVIGGKGKIAISGLSAPIEIVQVFDANYNLVFRCEGTDCGSEQTIANLTEGLYRVNTQFYNANWQFICQTDPIEVTVLPTDTGGGGDCDDLVVTGGEGTIAINGLTALIEIVQVFDANYNLIFRCEGTDCGTEVTVDNLAESLYRVNTQFYDSNWNFICEKQEAITIGGGNCQFDCSQTDIHLSTQAEVDAFCGCTIIEGDLTIGNKLFTGTPTNITSLASLNELKEVKGELKILEVQVPNLNGLNNLEKVGGYFRIDRIPNLTNMQGLDKLNSVGNIVISSLQQLRDLNGLQQLTVIENDLRITNNSRLNSIAQLSNLQVNSLDDLILSFNTSLASLNGLENITTIRNDFTLFRNNNLTELSPLRNIRLVQGDFRITENANLSDCCSIFHLVDDDPNNGRTRSSPILFSNAFPCRSKEELIPACVNTCVGVFVTGGNGVINVFGLAAPKEIVRIFDAQGNEIYACEEENCGDQQRVLQLAAGTYTVNVQFFDEANQLLCESLNNTVEVLPFIADCMDVKVSATVGQITVKNLNAPNAIVKVFDGDYVTQYECVREACTLPTQTIDLPPGFYRVNVDLRDEDFNSICTRNNMTIQVPDNPCTAMDYAPLVAFYNSLNGGNWFRKWNLNDCDICNWEGITCNATGRVTEINLVNNRLFGFLPPELVELDQLQLLDIKDNIGLVSSCFPNNYQQFCGQSISILSNDADLPFDGNFTEACLTGMGFTDADGDGVCDTDDCDDFNPEFPTSVGAICDDGDPNTIFDSIQSDGCTCRGDAPNQMADCNTIQYSKGSGQLTIGNLNAPRVNVQVYPEGQSFFPVFRCDDCEESEVDLTNLQGGNYGINVRYISFGNVLLCEKDTLITVDGANCEHPDAVALVAIFDSLGGAGWINQWPVTDCSPCSWYGVTCNNEGRVTEINLANNRLNGNIPPAIGNLDFLEKLVLSQLGAGSFFSGATTSIPSTIGQLKKLQVLDLSNSKGFSGLPKEIGGLESLKELNMFRAYFWGGLPEGIGNLQQLEILNLGYTYYTDFGPSRVEEFSNFSNIKELNLTSTGIDEIPTAIYGYNNLEKLALSENDISGDIPNQLFNLTKLVELKLNNNNFTGVIPSTVGNLSALEILALHQNQITSLPSEIGNLTNLKDLNVAFNPSLISLPNSLGNLQKLENFSAWNGNVSGDIPAAWSTIGALAESITINLNNNDLSGCYPSEIAAWCDAKYTISLFGNDLPLFSNFAQFCQNGAVGGDADGDGLCAIEDCDDNDPNLPAPPRTSCDDGNPNTFDDVIQTDGCTCLGVPNGNVAPTCDYIQFFGDNGQVEIKGINTGNVHLKIFNAGFSEILFECLYNCENPVIFTNPFAFGTTFNVEIQLYNEDESFLCEKRATVSVPVNNASNRGISIDILQLSAYPKKENIQLEWAAGQLYNTESFEVEFSENGLDFIKKEVVFPSKDEPTIFNWLDKEVSFGTNFYRIKQNFELGGFRYSSIQKVDAFMDEKEWKLFPNPVKNSLNLPTKQWKGKTGTIQIFNAFGHLVQQEKDLLFKEDFKTLEVGDLENGIYWLTVQTNNEQMVSKRFVVENWR